METATQIINLVLKFIIGLVAVGALAVMIYSMTILHSKIEFLALSAVVSLVLAIFTSLSLRKSDGAVNKLMDTPLPSLTQPPATQPPAIVIEAKDESS